MFAVGAALCVLVRWLPMMGSLEKPMFALGTLVNGVAAIYSAAVAIELSRLRRLYLNGMIAFTNLFFFAVLLFDLLNIRTFGLTDDSSGAFAGLVLACAGTGLVYLCASKK